MNAPTSSYQSNRRVSDASTPKTAKNDPGNNERLMKYLALLEAQESVTFEHMISAQKHKNHHRHHSPSAKHATGMLSPPTGKKDSKEEEEEEKELDSSIHKLLKSRRRDLRKAVHLISPSKKSSKRQQQVGFATPIDDGNGQQLQQQQQHQQSPSRRSTIIRAAATTSVPKASAAAVAKLPRARLFTSQEPANDADAGCNWTCAICQHGPSKSHHTMLTRLPCGHVFHNTCAVLWLGQSCACPTCRYEMETNDTAYEKARCERTKHRARATCSCPRTPGTNVCMFANSPGVVAMLCNASNPQEPADEDCSEASFEEDGEAIL